MTTTLFSKRGLINQANIAPSPMPTTPANPTPANPTSGQLRAIAANLRDQAAKLDALADQLADTLT